MKIPAPIAAQTTLRITESASPAISEPVPSPEAYEPPKIEDLFDGSKPKFGKLYDKYIASTQVPHPVDNTEYYDAAKDAQAASEFYGNIATISDPAERTAQLRKLVSESHKPNPKGYDYVVAKDLYTKVDRHPDGTVRSVYNQEPVKFLQYPDISLNTLSEKDLSAIAGASMSSPEVIGAWLGFQRGSAELNCEHVVPQSYFDKAEPMRSDLHHLYACNVGDNSKRGNTPYPGYHPEGGKGEVARATLYFMLRYPDVKLPYNSTSIETLKAWSTNDPPDTHELHRNQEIQKLQGNRNPFIDHPEWLKDFQP